MKQATIWMQTVAIAHHSSPYAELHKNIISIHIPKSKKGYGLTLPDNTYESTNACRYC